MAFTVEDFHDLIELLGQRPEWRADLRRLVLSDDLLELPALVRQLVDAQARAEARLEGVEHRLDRLEATVQVLVEAQARAEARLEGVEVRLDRLETTVQALVDAQGRSEARLGALEATLQRLAEAQAGAEEAIRDLAGSQRRLEVRQGTMDGRLLELDYARQAPSYLSPIAIRLRVIDAGSLANLLDDAVDADQLTAVERDAIMRTDLVLSGRRREDRQDVYLLAALSVGVGEHDVERAVERARLLEKLGRPVLPVVAGERITDEAAQLAREQGVWYARGGRVTAPRST